MDIFPVFLIRSELFDPAVKTLNLFGKLVIGKEILGKDLLIQTIWFQCPEPFQMSLRPMIRSTVKAIIMSQAERQYLLLYFFQGKLMIISHAEIFFRLLILLSRDMYRAIVMMCQTPGNESSISFVRFNLFLTRRF